MYFDLAKESAEIASIEAELIELSRLRRKGSFERWSLWNTINHACSWKICAIQKVATRLLGQDSSFKAKTPIEVLNREFYEKTKDYGAKQTLAFIEECRGKIATVCAQIKGKEKSAEFAPTGFAGSVFDFLKGDLIYHPISHYFYYALRNDEYEIFLRLKKYVSKSRATVYNDLKAIDIGEIADPALFESLFEKGIEWRQDELFTQLKERRPPP